ncbi:BglG family transcription antiterminator [Paraclostridium bifermentans]|uniref:BglG family transcription antiterminator n=1 Tax=Paraclostridium bifermentans TaxID=1490 RepID=UPI001C0F641A|nr:BglG family transcription antiterminator [Paraclostridium bifermentans]MBS5952184.1 transcription antiterminator [Paraclostridium bifermentans]MBU5287578.1 BglG family transcription antiterminator [Paraclostridium bifermentans]
MKLNKRLEDILDILMNHEYVKIEKIVKLLNISRRTVYYDISKINDHIKKYNLEISNVRNLGYHISSEDKDKIRKVLKYSKDDYILSSEERCISIIIDLFLSLEKLTIERYCNKLLVSRNTVLNDIKNVREYISKYKLELEAKNGYKLVGSNNSKRYLFINLYNEYNYFFDEYGYMQVFEDIKALIKNENLNIFKNTNANYILMYLAIFYKNYYVKNKDTITFKNEDKNFLDSLDSHKEVKRLLNIIRKVLNNDIDEDEVYYIQTFFTKDEDIRTYFYQNELNSKYILPVNMMVKEFEKISCISIEDYDVLSKNILNHLIPSIFKIRYGIYYLNLIKSEVKQKYKSIYQFTKQVVKTIENNLDIYLNDDEIAYIAMYFGGYSSKMGVEIKIPKIVIVCNSGMATSQLLKNQIEQLFDLIEIQDILSLKNFENYEKYYDFAITTVDLNQKQAIKVNPILTDLDKQNLLSQISNTQSVFNFEQEFINKIINGVEKYATISNKEKLREEIKNIVISSREKGKSYKATLRELLNEDTIYLNQEATSWEDAIRVSANPLKNLGYIKDSYIDAMIENVRKLGPYIVIAPKVAMPHARPEDGVNKVSMTLTTFKEDIYFSGKDQHKVKILISLAPKDNQTHIKALACLTKMLSKKENIDKILNSKDKYEILEVINKYSR